MKNAAFYQYVEITNPMMLQKSLIKLCKALGLRGKILVAKEGVNGSVSGKEKNIAGFMKEFKRDKRFKTIEFKLSQTPKHNFNRLVIKIRDQIITTKHWDADPKHAAPYVEPRQLKKWLDNKQDCYLVDARNTYEYKIGHFKKARGATIATFGDFPRLAGQLKALKNKRIVTYCTGGIRCEKASAYLREHGFTNVYQLHGGILKYGEQCKDKHWEGRCFVFDQRGAIALDPKKEMKPIARCDLCNMPADTYYNCKRTLCDKRFISCEFCFKNLRGCCSKQCRNKLFDRVLKTINF